MAMIYGHKRVIFQLKDCKDMSKEIKVGDLVRYAGKNPFNRPNIYGWIGKVTEKRLAVSVRNTTVVSCVINPPLPGGEIINRDHKFCGAEVEETVLRKIEGLEGPDETFSWVGKPVKEKECV